MNFMQRHTVEHGPEFMINRNESSTKVGKVGSIGGRSALKYGFGASPA